MKKTLGILVIILIVIVGIAGYFILSDNEDDSNGESNENIVEDNSSNDNSTSEKNSEEVNDSDSGESNVETMVILVIDGSHEITFELNNSDAARSLYEQLPLTIEVEDFSSNEKIFYPTNELDVGNTPRANGKDAGILAYYEPWGDVVMFYDSFSSASGLYELGTAIKNTNQIASLSGEITIERLEN